MKLPELWTFMLLFCTTSSELYSSAVGLEKFLQTENSIIQIYQSFVLKTEKQIAELKRQIERLEKEHEKTKGYVSDPFNNYHLVKRILIEWNSVENILSDSLLQEVKKNITELKSSKDFPTEQDLTGSAHAINLISDTYNIEIGSLANGNMNGIQYPSQLSADDCYDMGLQSYMRHDFYFAYSWMDEALKRIHKEGNLADADIIEKSLEIKAYSAYQLGDFSTALNITTELLKLYPNNTNAPSNIEHYTYMLSKKKVPKPEEKKQSALYWEIMQRDICRKAISPPVEITSQLKCRYVHNDVPFLRIAPIKEEEAFLNPRIVLFKDAIYDSEIEIIKELAIPKLHSALVLSHKDGADVLSKNRLAHMNWTNIQHISNEHPTLRNILLRAEDMTKLDPYKAEQLHVVNYGVGGHYKLHLDSLKDYGMHHMKYGNRIATLLYYMNDVDQGGATVFTKLNMGVVPEKGTAVLWYNQLPDGNQKDERTIHSSCPVMAGTKWICTIWFHAIGQELRRPCELKQ